MNIILIIITLFVALEHIGFMWLEMAAWTTRGPKVFRMLEKSLFEKTKVLAANQGLYNGFLAAGLIWGLCISNPVWRLNIIVFFLVCVSAAGIYGAYSASKRIFWVQAVPALLGLSIALFLKYS